MTNQQEQTRGKHCPHCQAKIRITDPVCPSCQGDLPLRNSKKPRSKLQRDLAFLAIIVAAAIVGLWVL